jgi:enolase
MIIKALHAREIFDARGAPTIECVVTLDSGVHVVSSVPSGTSRGMHEAVELRDDTPRLMGMGVKKAVAIINNDLAPIFIGKEPDCVQADADMLQLDGTDNKKRLGSNTMLAVSMVLYRAHALAEDLPLYAFIAYVCGFEKIVLPIPMFNLINGGMHAYNGLPIQEHMLVPLGTLSMTHAIELGAASHMILKDTLFNDGRSTVVGDEGGFACLFADETEALDLLMNVREEIETRFDSKMALALDVAASHLYDSEQQVYEWHGEYITADALINVYAALAEAYPLYALEDGLNEVDWSGWQQLHARIGEKTMIVGDDLCVTEPTRIAHGIEQGVLGGVVIKPNQIGTVTEALQAVKLCKQHNIAVIASHRSGETNDHFIADFAAGISATHIKAGGFTRGECMAKYNRLLAIEQELLHAQPK